MKKNWLEKTDHQIIYEYFEKTNNAIIDLFIYNKISNRQDIKFRTNNNINDFINLISFFNKTLINDSQIIIYPGDRGGSIKIKIILINNIKEILEELKILESTEKYNL